MGEPKEWARSRDGIADVGNWGNQTTLRNPGKGPGFTDLGRYLSSYRMSIFLYFYISMFHIHIFAYFQKCSTHEQYAFRQQDV
jgi:hypothetical protein